MAFWLSPEVSTRDPIISPRAFALALALEVKYGRIRPVSLFITIGLQISLGFFLQGEINCWGGWDRKISALVSAPVSALYMTFGSQGWTALFDTLGQKV